MKKKTQLNLLTSCIFFEDKEFYKKLSVRPIYDTYNLNFQLNKRPLLDKIMNNLKKIAEKHDLNKFELNCQIPGLNIIGITGYKKNIYKVVNIEVLDEYTTMKNVENMPTGLMQLKLRLLERLDEALIVVSSYIKHFYLICSYALIILCITGLGCVMFKESFQRG